MARIRSVHPGLFTDDAFIQLSDAAQIFWIGLWTEADDQGVFEWKPATLKLRLRGAATAPVEPLLAELEALGCIQKFSVGGRDFGAVRNFQKFQRPKKPNRTFVLPDEFRDFVGSEHRGSEPETPVTEESSPPSQSIRPLGSEPYEDEAPPVPPKSEKPPQMEDGGGGGRGSSASLRSADAVPPSPPVDPPDPKTALWRAGLAILRRLTGMADGPGRKFLGRLCDAAQADHAGLLALLERAETEQPSDPRAWLTAGAQRLGGLAAPGPGGGPVDPLRDGVTAWWDPWDAWGLREWLWRQAGTRVEPHPEQSNRLDYSLHGWWAEEDVGLLLLAASVPESARPNLDEAAGWLKDGIHVAAPSVLDAVRAAVARIGAIRSLKALDGVVRQAHSRRAA